MDLFDKSRGRRHSGDRQVVHLMQNGRPAGTDHSAAAGRFGARFRVRKMRRSQKYDGEWRSLDALTADDTAERNGDGRAALELIPSSRFTP